MKKLLTILFLAVAIFNMGGYGLFMAYMEERANEQMDEQLNANKYDASALVTIKVPVTSLPYYTNSEQFERKTGEIEIDGVKYNYVSRRIYNDTLEVQYISNAEVTSLNTARNDFYKICNDLENAGKSKKATPNFKFFSPGNCKQKNSANDLSFAGNNISFLSLPPERLPFFYTTVIEDPPESQLIHII